MPLKEKFNVIHSSPRIKRHNMSHRVRVEASVSVRRQKEMGRKWRSVFTGASMGVSRHGRVKSLGLASLNNSSSFGNILGGS